MLAESKNNFHNNCARLIIADDHAIVRYALKGLVESNNMEVAAEAKNANELIELLDTVKCDLLVINISISGYNAVPALLQTIINKIKHHTPVLVMSLSNDIRIASSVLQTGASGYITISSEPMEFIEAINKVAFGGKYICPKIAEKILFHPEKFGSGFPPEKLLSRREYQIFLMLLEGKPIDSIASELSISRQTVGTHKTRLMRKLGIQNNVDIVRYAMQHGLLAI